MIGEGGVTHLSVLVARDHTGVSVTALDPASCTFRLVSHHLVAMSVVLAMLIHYYGAAVSNSRLVRRPSSALVGDTNNLTWLHAWNSSPSPPSHTFLFSAPPFLSSLILLIAINTRVWSTQSHIQGCLAGTLLWCWGFKNKSNIY